MAPFVPMGSFICEDPQGYELCASMWIKEYYQIRKPRNMFTTCIYRNCSAPWETRHQKVPAERSQSKQLYLKESQME